MTDEPQNLTRHRARQALDTVDAMERVGWRHAAPPKWFSIVNALVIVLIVASFAYKNDEIVLGTDEVVFGIFVPLTLWQAAFIGLCLGIAIIMWICSERLSAHSWGVPRTKSEWLDLCGYLAGFTVLVVCSFVFTRFFDLVWVSLVMSVVAGVWTYSWFERERQRCLNRAQSKKGAPYGE